MPRFDIPALTDGVPEMRIKRGENYLAHGWVSLVDASDGAILAHVMGERGIAYPVELAAADGRGARCACPDFAESGLTCKHIIAVALKVNAGGDQDLAEAAQRLPRLHDMLEMEGRDDAELLVEKARRDPVLLRQLEGEA